MKKIILSLSMTFLFITSNAQEIKIDSTALKNWYHQDYSKTGVYGVGTDAAISFLKSKGLKPSTIVVGVIDSGVQVDHPDLKKNIWVNPKEKAGNGKDDDKNGYIDDINGWNFIGGKNEEIDHDTMEMTRLVVKYEKLFDSENAIANKNNIEKFPSEYDDYKRAKKNFTEKLSKAELGLANMKSQTEQIQNITFALKTALGDKKITIENAENITNPNLKDYVSKLAEDPEIGGKTVYEFEKIALEQTKDGLKYYTNQVEYMLNKKYDPRSIVGDNYEDLSEKYYGNNKVEGADALHGTHVAGIIAAERGNNIGMDGIAGDVAKIMVVRAVPNGDERDKDVANAIIYAIDNGAKIINMSFGKSFSPDRKKVWKTIEYAEKKGVLLVHAAGNDNKNIDITYNYPTNFKDEEKTSFINNWITVGASTRYNENLKASFSNYGYSKVDIFAPGLEIYSTINKSGYKFLQGTSMASPVVSGCAALLWAYFPHLKAEEVKEILMITSNKSKEYISLGDDADSSFNQLSVIGGIVDINKAVQYAYEKYGSGKKSKRK